MNLRDYSDQHAAQQHTAQKPTSLINALCDKNRHAVRRPTSVEQVFPQFKYQPNFHCSSLFRRPQTSSNLCDSFYDPRQPMVFSDGRVYEIVEFHIMSQTNSEIAYRACMDVIEAEDSEFLPFEVWFYKSYFSDSALEKGQCEKRTRIPHDPLHKTMGLGISSRQTQRRGLVTLRPPLCL